MRITVNGHKIINIKNDKIYKPVTRKQRMIYSVFGLSPPGNSDVEIHDQH
jgi:hypothetical protein